MTEPVKPHGVIMRELLRRRRAPKRTDLVPASPAEVTETHEETEEDTEEDKPNVVAMGRTRVTETEWLVFGKKVPEATMLARPSRIRRLYNRLRLQRARENEPQLTKGSE